MSIDKWLDEKGSKEERIKREQAFKRLTKDEVQELKKKKLREMVKKEGNKEKDKFLESIIEFKDWLNQRTYLKGDFERIEMWIKNLNSLLNMSSKWKEKSELHNEKKRLIEKYKEIPPKFLDEKTRVAINKLIYGTQRTNSDNYYLRKLKTHLREKQKESEYYEIIDKLFKIL